MAESLDTWFAREILPLEGALLRYLARTWTRRDQPLSAADIFALCCGNFRLDPLCVTAEHESGLGRLLAHSNEQFRAGGFLEGCDAAAKVAVATEELLIRRIVTFCGADIEPGRHRVATNSGP